MFALISLFNFPHLKREVKFGRVATTLSVLGWECSPALSDLSLPSPVGPSLVTSPCRLQTCILQSRSLCLCRGLWYQENTQQTSVNIYKCSEHTNLFSSTPSGSHCLIFVHTDDQLFDANKIILVAIETFFTFTLVPLELITRN